MKLIQNRDPDEKLKTILLNELQDALIEHLNVERSEVPTIASCLHEFLRFEENLQSMISSSVAQLHLKDQRDNIKEM